LEAPVREQLTCFRAGGSINQPDPIAALHKGLIVSCQAPQGSPLSRPQIIAALSLAAERSGAAAVRINGASNIREVRRRVRVPIIGIEKQPVADTPVYITPTFASLRRVLKSGADIVALDGTGRRRPGGQSLAEIIRRAKLELGATIMADVATVEEGLSAAELGADVVATTLHGYTRATGRCEEPAFDVLSQLVRQSRVPVILEGRLRSPADVRRAFELGAFAVVVGTAITGIEWLVREFAAATPCGRQRRRRPDVE
jgi:N-acylglucosamine-6-phosphate 2-epimerase